MLGGGGGSIQDMINRFRDNRAMLGRRKIRFKSGKRFFDEKPVTTTTKIIPAIFQKTSERQLNKIRSKLRKDARFNLIISWVLILISLLLLFWFMNWVLKLN
jgi:hypothetical protein